MMAKSFFIVGSMVGFVLKTSADRISIGVIQENWGLLQMNDFGPEKYTAETNLLAAVAAIAQFNGERTATAAAIAHNSLEFDLGRYGNEGLSDYSLDDVTRNRLLAHARRDASRAANIGNLLASEVNKLKSMVFFLTVVVLCLFVYLIIKL